MPQELTIHYTSRQLFRFAYLTLDEIGETPCGNAQNVTLHFVCTHTMHLQCQCDNMKDKFVKVAGSLFVIHAIQ